MEREELNQCFEQYRRTGDISLRNKIAEHYMYIAEILAKKFVGRGVDYDDLYQVACLALVKGVERFDPGMGMQFTTFITPTVTGEIKNYFRDKSRTVRLPRKLAKLGLDVRKKRDEILSLTGKKPTPKEIAQSLGVEEEDVLQAMEIGSVVSLDSSVSTDGEERSLYDVLPDDANPFEAFEDKEMLVSAIQNFNQTEREVLRLRYEKGLSQMATAEELNVSQMFVSRMERKLLQKLRTLLQDQA
ncbi:MAG: sigma-70 family RNA polymerase sigma factor [Clostridia bacterium]|nr:sigma-70 family RNA polymerase sigma factor [Clostridia bacterium]